MRCPGIATITLCASLLAAPAVITAQADRTPKAEQKPVQQAERFSAIAANISNVGATGITPVDIRLERWTSDVQNERLLAALRDKGQDAFLRELVDEKRVGWISTPTSLRYEFFYARETAGPNGQRHIMMITDRPMAIAERLQATPSREYPFTVIQMRLDKDGRGEGQLLQLVQLRLIGDVLGIENLATAPIKLNQIRRVE